MRARRKRPLIKKTAEAIEAPDDTQEKIINEKQRRYLLYLIRQKNYMEVLENAGTEDGDELMALKLIIAETMGREVQDVSSKEVRYKDYVQIVEAIDKLGELPPPEAPAQEVEAKEQENLDF